MKQFWIRVQSALVFAAVMVGGILWNQYSCGALFLIITMLSLHEYYNIVHPTLFHSKVTAIYRPFLVGSGVIIYLLSFLSAAGLLSPYVLAITPLFLFLPFITELFADSSSPVHNIGLQLAGLLYIGVSFAMLNFIMFYDGSYHAFPLLGIILMIWAYDSLAYLTGSWLGRRKMLPRLSPKKSWEGLGGGIVGLVLVAILLSYIVPRIPLADWLTFGALIAVTGTLGDLVISLIKRSLHIKDTGSLIPGHGGVLDRFDALILTVPFAAVYIFFRF